MDDLHVEAAGIVIKEGGYKRPPLAVARDFVRDARDADRLAELLAAYAATSDGPIIPPFAFGREACLCPAGNESWCRAIGCPRKPVLTPPRAEGA
jgi:hypothetical protein